MKVDMIHSSSWGTGDRVGVVVVVFLVSTLIGLLVWGISDNMTANRLKEEFYGREISIPAKKEIGIGFVTGIKDGKLMVYFPEVGMVALEEDMVRVVEKGEMTKP